MKVIIIILSILLLGTLIYLAIQLAGLRALSKKIDEMNLWSLESYQYVITAEDDNVIEVFSSDGTSLGKVTLPDSSELNKLIERDNE